jgi:alkylhydroperoxidase family enzyme
VAVQLEARLAILSRCGMLARKYFSEQELADLKLAVVAINGWNRLNIAFQTPAGNYQPGQFEKMKKSA